MTEEIAASPDREFFDFIVRGEGEFTFKELTESLHSDNPSLEDIPGLSFRDDGYFIHNQLRLLINLCELKLPKRKSVELFPVNYGIFGRSEVIESTRGCTYSCSFCGIRHMYGRTFRRFALEWVIQDIRNAKECGTVRVFFADDNITLDRGNL